MERYVPLWFTGRVIPGHACRRATRLSPAKTWESIYNVVGPDYFRTLEIPLVAGRDFSEQDRTGAPRVVIVNQTMANRFWPGQDATGHRVQIAGEWRTVVGVARDIKYHRMNEAPQPFLYSPALQVGGTDTNIIVRSSMPTAAVVSAIRAAAQSLDSKVQPLETDDSERIAAHLAVCESRGRDARECARCARHAAGGARNLRRAFLQRQPAIPRNRNSHGAGRAVARHLAPRRRPGIAAVRDSARASEWLSAWRRRRAMSSLLFGVSATDPTTFAAVVVIVTFAATFAAYVPARRALRVDPMVALRYE